MATSANQKFPRARHLKGRRLFARVFGARCSAANRRLVIYASANELPYARIGIVAGRKLGHAVRRNRLKRLIREAFRLEYARLPAGFDLICIPSADAEAGLPEFRRSLRRTVERAVERWKKSDRGRENGTARSP